MARKSYDELKKEILKELLEEIRREEIRKDRYVDRSISEKRYEIPLDVVTAVFTAVRDKKISLDYPEYRVIKNGMLFGVCFTKREQTFRKIMEAYEQLK